MTDPHWTQVLSALLMPVVAILGVYIACRQWKTSRDRLKLDLFEKRFAVYQATRTFIKSIISSGKAEDQPMYTFLASTGEAKWLFDAKVADYLKKRIWEPAVDLQTLESELQGMPVGEDRTKKVQERSILLKQIMDELRQIDDVFGPHLKLSH